MTKKITLFSIAILLSITSTFLYAQVVPTKNYKVAIFSPLYLDSAFDGTFYKYAKGVPKFTQPGFDFVQGAKIALDSLPLSKGTIKANVYDSKAELENISWLIKNGRLDSLDMIIGSVKDAELLQLATFAKQKNIPFISATSPSDGGITANPFFVMQNATLRAHCESIYSYIMQKHGTDKIYLCRQKGGQEDKIASYFKSINERDGMPLLAIETINFTDDYATLKDKLDSNRTSVIIGASLNDDFAKELVNASFDISKSYPLEVIGMPNWESFSELKTITLKEFPIVCTAAYYNPKTDIYSKKIQTAFNKKFKGNASEMVCKGFESVYVFVNLLT
ncbi:MAG: ABC transporter substrate-binding protein, partial [Ferruginibacter sp.]